MIQCPKCSAENDDEALYCDQCGTAVAPQLRAEALATPCPACGGEVRQVPSVMAVCQACGLSLGESMAPSSGCDCPQPHAPAAEPEQEAPATPAAPAEPVEKWDCPICALDNPVDAVRCGDCGILFQKTPRPYPCPRCKVEVTGEKCAGCGTVLLLSKLAEYLDPSVRWVCPTCKQLYSADKDKCPDCGDELEPADDLKDYAKKLKAS